MATTMATARMVTVDVLMAMFDVQMVTVDVFPVHFVG